MVSNQGNSKDAVQQAVYNKDAKTNRHKSSKFKVNAVLLITYQQQFLNEKNNINFDYIYTSRMQIN